MTAVVAISRCKNEADIVEPWVRHTLAHVDRLIVSENDSADDTPAILAALVAEGLPLTVLQESTVGDYQSRVMSRMMRDAAVAGADWVVPLDTDEFIECDGRFADLLAASGPPAVRSMQWQTFVWYYGDDPSDRFADINPAVQLRYRLMEETYYQKVVVPRAPAMVRELSAGSHFLLPDGDRGVPLDDVRLCHFPLRSLDQFKLKASIGYLQMACVPGWDLLSTGVQFNHLPDVAKMTEQGLIRASRRYATQMPDTWEPKGEYWPLDYRGGLLRYTTAKERFAPALLKYASSLAAKLAETVST